MPELEEIETGVISIKNDAVYFEKNKSKVKRTGSIYGLDKYVTLSISDFLKLKDYIKKLESYNELVCK
jgi:hypothetical protein